MIREGSRVAYVGDGDDGLVPGDQGKVLANAGQANHVMWSTGVRAGEVTLTHEHDLVCQRQAARYEDLESGSLVTISVRNTWDRAGAVGLLNALNEEGHLATFAPIAEEAIRMVASRIRQDPSIGEVLARLDPDEGAEFVSFAATCLLRDAFGEGD